MTGRKKANLVKKIHFKHATKFGEKIAAVHMKKNKSGLGQADFCWGGHSGSLQNSHV